MPNVLSKMVGWAREVVSWLRRMLSRFQTFVRRKQKNDYKTLDDDVMDESTQLTGEKNEEDESEQFVSPMSDSSFHTCNQSRYDADDEYSNMVTIRSASGSDIESEETLKAEDGNGSNSSTAEGSIHTGEEHSSDEE